MALGNGSWADPEQPIFWPYAVDDAPTILYFLGYKALF